MPNTAGRCLWLYADLERWTVTVDEVLVTSRVPVPLSLDRISEQRPWKPFQRPLLCLEALSADVDYQSTTSSFRTVVFFKDWYRCNRQHQDLSQRRPTTVTLGQWSNNSDNSGTGGLGFESKRHMWLSGYHIMSIGKGMMSDG